jgi:hypothetical protein
LRDAPALHPKTKKGPQRRNVIMQRAAFESTLGLDDKIPRIARG